MTDAPINTVLVDGANTSKSAFRSYEIDRNRIRVAALSVIQSGNFLDTFGFDFGGVNYDRDTADTSTADDGVSVIVDIVGTRFKRVTSIAIRERFIVDRTYFVRTPPVNVSVTIATPGVVTWNAHALLANAAVVLAILPQRKSVTISIASPGVITWVAHGLPANQPVKFETTGFLPGGLVAGTTYFVVGASITTDTFQVSATAGGAAINTTTTGVAFTVTIASPGVFTKTAHGFVAGTPVRFGTTGALPTGLVAGTQYYVIAAGITANDFRVSTTVDGAAVNTSGTQSGTHYITGQHFGLKTGTMPTGLVAGTVYYVVGASITINTFQLSATPGGAAINTTGTTTGQISGQTGSDSNNGQSNGAGAASNASSTTGAWLTPQVGINWLRDNVDGNGKKLVLQLADGHYAMSIRLYSILGVDPAGWGTNELVFRGNTANLCNVFVESGANAIYGVNCDVGWKVEGFKIKGVIGCFGDNDTKMFLGKNYYDVCSLQVSSLYDSKMEFVDDYTIGGAAVVHEYADSAGKILSVAGITVTIVNNPALTFFASSLANSLITASGVIYNGMATGTRIQIATGGGLYHSLGAASTILPGTIAGAAVSPGWIG